MVSTCDLSLLADNLEALQKFQEGSDSGVKPNSSSSFERNIWRWFDTLIGKRPSLDEDALPATLEKVKLEFLRFLDEQDLVKTTLHIDIHSRPAKELTDAEKSLLSVGTECLFLTTHRMLLDPASAIDSLQRLYQQRTNTPMLDGNYLSKLEHFTRRYAQVAIAALLESAYPVCCFSKCIQQQPLEYAERETLHKWVKALEKNKTQLSVHLFHLALTGVVEELLPSLGIASSELARTVSILEWRLYCGWSSFIGEPDQSYMQWLSERIKPGTHTLCNGKKLLIGKPVEFSLPKNMRARLYELPEDPTSLLLAGCNPASLGIWQINDEFCGRAGSLIQVKEKDSRLGCFIVERVNTALVDVVWQTTTAAIAPADKPCLDELAKLISWFVANGKNTPKNLSIDHIYFHASGNKAKLRLLLPFDDRGPHDFAIIERFVQASAKNNRWIYRYLVRASGLEEHFTAVRVRDIVMKALSNPSDLVTVQEYLNSASICDPEFIDQVVAMVTALQGWQKTCVFTLSPQLKSKSLQKKLSDCIAEALVAHQIDRGYISSVDPGLLELQGRLAFEQKFKETYSYLFLQNKV